MLQETYFVPEEKLASSSGQAAARVMCLCFDIAVLRVTMKSH